MSRQTLFKMVGLSLLCLMCVACAQTMQFTPRPAAYSNKLALNIVDVQVNDLRADSTGDGLKAVLRDQVLSTLSLQAPSNSKIRYRLVIDIIQHGSFFTAPNWNASSRFRAKLLDENERLIGQWDLTGAAHQYNMAGYSTAEAVSQDSYNIAIADLISSLSQVSMKELSVNTPDGVSDRHYDNSEGIPVKVFGYSPVATQRNIKIDSQRAMIDAKVKAIERAGVKIESSTLVSNFELMSDLVESKSKGVLLPGFEFVELGYDENGAYKVLFIGSVRSLK
ncbi:hypothetical protein [Geomesophilobacter sediminis]|uniref:DUF541 domain-containing protein n=1 Tax=Geomesophilobacter sediminis TaxID=2798584 RepID=A0A8J7S783_9BACT|nr:hypothetical protein [Geomesophilobacter sediminis]MBJ6726802.1 hypothetical protein [Geomesophilobacter sediminis]